MSAMGRNKGARGELELLKLLQPAVDSVLGVGKVLLTRNLVQTRDGGFDIEGLHWLALEVKRQESLSLGTWWQQAMRQAGSTRVPVLAYRQNNRPWRIRMQVDVLGEVVLVEMSLEDWLPVFVRMLEHWHGH